VSDEIRKGRKFLRSNWDLLDGVVSDQAAGTPMPEMQKPIPPGSAIVDLVPSDRLPEYPVPLATALARRESRRKYSEVPVSLEELSFLLWATQGVRRATAAYSKRTAPSAGARHSIETYLYLSGIDELDTGLYRYLALQHKLCLISAIEDVGNRIDKALHGQRWNSAGVFVWTSIPYRMEWRYSYAAHKLIALDVGHICQNLYLACECIGCGTCAIGAYDQDLLDAALGVDDRDEIAVYAAPFGKI
jgi:SagB-type dehydrogenase family enzyme